MNTEIEINVEIEIGIELKVGIEIEIETELEIGIEIDMIRYRGRNKLTSNHNNSNRNDHILFAAIIRVR